MTLPQVVSREQWLVARKRLLALDLTPLGRQHHVGEAVHHDQYGS